MGVPSAQAGSIWAKASKGAQTPYTDDTARKVGDILTIVINERSVIENDTNRNLEKKSSASATTDGTVDLANAVGQPVGKRIFDLPKVNVDAKAENKFDGKATYDSNRSVVDQITVAVRDVMPNGNLVVTGTRQRDMDGDRQVIEVSGIVRASDISFTNKVRSEQVADFTIVYKSKGPENNFTKPGWLARILNWLNPF